MVPILIFIFTANTGCQNQFEKKSFIGLISGNDKMNNTNSNKSTGNISDYRQIFEGEFKIYKISRDSFNLFLEDFQHSSLRKDFEEYKYPDYGEWYITYGVSRFPIRNTLLDFIGNKSNIEKYLSQNGVNTTIEDMAVFEAPYVPLTIWVKTTTGNFYITINEDPDDELYVYRFYTESAYCEKYKCVEGKLIVNGNEMKGISTKIYNNCAEVPLVTVIEALGGNISFQSDTEVNIYFNGKAYYLDIENKNLFALKNKGENLLYNVAGGLTFISSIEKELIVDDAVLKCVLYDMGADVIVRADNNMVAIDYK